MKKRYILEVLLIVAALVFPFYNASKPVSWDTLITLTETSVNGNIMQKLSEKKVRQVYEILTTDYDECISYGPIAYMDVDEITIFRQSDASKRQVLLEAANRHIEKQINIFEGYASKQTAMLKSALVIEKQDYVICIVSEDNKVQDEILEKF